MPLYLRILIGVGLGAVLGVGFGEGPIAPRRILRV
jgi:hypothetical protein